MFQLSFFSFIVIGLLPDAHRERIVAEVRRRIQRRKEVGSSV
jgi:hypothetical protein